MAEPVIPHIEQYGGLWLIEPAAGNALRRQIEDMDLVAHAREWRAQREAEDEEGKNRPGYEIIEDGIAVVELVGLMTKFGSSLSRNPGSVRLRRTIRLAIQDERVRAIVLRIDSPGGTVRGTSDLAEAVYAARSEKPVVAYVEDTAASGAYWVASQADEIYANRTAEVGSIGVLTAVEDWSGSYEKRGIIVHAIRSTALKGADLPVGAPVSAEKIADLQREVDEVHAEFVAAVARGRGIERAAAERLADARVHIGANAVAVGLVDGIQSFEATLAELAARINEQDKEYMMSGAQEKQEKITVTASETPPADAPQVATIAQLKTAFPGSTAEWREDCLEKGLSMAQAKDAWVVELTKQIGELRTQQKALAEQHATERAGLEAERDELKAKVAQLTKAAEDGGEAVAFTGEQGGAPASEDGGDEETWKAEYGRDASIRKEFGSVGAYVAYRKAVAGGNVKVRTG